ncbi:hypothetical protein PRZ48_005386 [Zasmidium cellare]|uniref:Uncharacterized protein n=1 Tax=Zasmidium cellare TaxID=395010 RepID=A0ABR0ESN1_ZASCE|nr:hypothetical protein PRZ48_005386 [Zasmidium cellare]
MSTIAEYHQRMERLAVRLCETPQELVDDIIRHALANLDPRFELVGNEMIKWTTSEGSLITRNIDQPYRHLVLKFLKPLLAAASRAPPPTMWRLRGKTRETALKPIKESMVMVTERQIVPRLAAGNVSGFPYQAPSIPPAFQNQLQRVELLLALPHRTITLWPHTRAGRYDVKRYMPTIKLQSLQVTVMRSFVSKADGAGSVSDQRVWITGQPTRRGMKDDFEALVSSMMSLEVEEKSLVIKQIHGDPTYDEEVRRARTVSRRGKDARNIVKAAIKPYGTRVES